jgi:predicted hydrolase (HD superfamily)
MIQQAILPFKLERTDEQITARSGLALFAELVRAFKVEDKVERYFPRPGSNRGYEAWSYVEPLLLMMEGGGRHVEDLREIQDDDALRTLVGLETMPSLSTFGDWMARAGAQGGRAAMGVVNEDVAKAILSHLPSPAYTLDVDTTVIEAEKEEAAWTYKKVKGYQPILGYLAENGVCLAHEFREGNINAQTGARTIGQEMGLDKERVEGLRLTGIIHDIGKISVPAEILSKPGSLNETEYKLIQAHPKVGHDILGDIDFSWPIAEIVLQHHERMNGSGYPAGLKGDDILLEARILAVSDVVEAMASHRPYRPALGIEVALEEIEKNKGVLYDPDVVAACLKLFREKGFIWS